MKRSIRTSALIAAILAGSAAHAADRPNFNAYDHAKAVQPARAGARDRAAPAIVASTDPQRGVPTFVWAPRDLPSLPQLSSATPERAGRAWLDRYARHYQLSPEALSTAQVAQVHDIGRGAIIVTFRQNVDGIDVYRNELKVVMRRDLSLVAISGNLHPSAVNGYARGGAVTLSPSHALAGALNDLYGMTLKASDVDDTKKTKAGYGYFDLESGVTLASGLRLTEPARVKPVYYPMPDRLVSAYFVEFIAGQASSVDADAYSYVIAADDGRVLYRQNLTYNAFNWRVWAEPDGFKVPLAGPQADFMPHPTGMPGAPEPAFIAPILVNVNGFNTNPGGTFDPWLPLNATQTSGNNVDAYADLGAPNGFSGGDLRASTTAAQTFDRTYNVNLGPASSQGQIMAAVTQLFYVNNWLHDWYYDSGFNEAAGNAQVDNLNRGGIAGDPLLVEAQDYSGTNNANMNPMSDGASPRMQMYVWTGTNPNRDGTIDNSIVAHEWGHYVHLRQVPCASQQCGAQSEGWSDFIALHMLLKDNDDLSRAFPMAVYATAGYADPYFGIRRAPYSNSFDYNAMTFRHISDNQQLPNTHPVTELGSNAQIHNAGEIWSSMLFDAYVGLIQLQVNGQQAHTFAEAKRLMTDYMVGGMKAAAVDPTYTEQRDGILAAAAAASTDDFVALAAGFARRGAGTCAVSPPKASMSLNGVVEDFDLRPNFQFSATSFDDSADPCDNDGILDANETGRVMVEIFNSGTAPLTDAQATISTAVPGVSFPSGQQVSFGTIAPFSKGVASVEVALGSAFTTAQALPLDITLTSAETCVQELAEVSVRLVNYDETPASSKVDTVESENASWAAEGTVEGVWSRELDMSGANHHWRGIDFPSVSDTSITSPDLEVSASEPFVITFQHRYKFEFSDSTNWDGAVIEISDDGGTSWTDMSSFAQTGYNGTITDISGNPLANRVGFVNQSPEWPAKSNVSLDLGTAFAGQTVKVRFRIGTDAAAGEHGWELDELAFSGIVNTPFPTLSDNSGECAPPGTGGGGQGGSGQGGSGQGGDQTNSDPLVVNDEGCGCEVAGGSSGSGSSGTPLIPI
ncbi:MAG TPA: M36 family metallopeptidase, partial [Candidatus Nanopelagicales bacterium]|nr:M36 family metallopeptidase [Candidatus Nanopelagicales bacterium]